MKTERKGGRKTRRSTGPDKAKSKVEAPANATAKAKVPAQAPATAAAKTKTPAKAAAKAKAGQRVFEGLGVSPGVGIGVAHQRESGEIRVLEYQVPARRVPEELERFHGAVARARRQVAKLVAKAERFHGAASEELGYLLEAHLQMLKSASLIGAIERRIEDTRCNAEFAVMTEIGAIVFESRLNISIQSATDCPS